MTTNGKGTVVEKQAAEVLDPASMRARGRG
jgi:hypothetical protein